MGKYKTHEEYIKDLKQVHPDIRVIGLYTGSKTKITHECLVCGHLWNSTPNCVLRNNGCPECAKIRIPMLRTHTHEYYVQQLKDKNINIRPLEQYKKQKIKIKHRCLQCGYEWDVQPSQILHLNTGCGCPICSHRAIGPAPEYKNSIWASNYNQYCSKYLTEEQMKSYMPHSQKYINAVCPDCGNVKRVKVADLIYRGFRCMCGDGQSFPNKFVFNVLKQLKLNVQPEYTPPWANGKRYDDYLVDYNLIIENHGIQHYEEIPWWSLNKTFAELKQCDQDKYDMAVNNGIKRYIVLDCRESSANWIKKSIMTSELPLVLNFEEDDIDWLQALQYASSNLVKEAVKLFKDGWTASKMESVFHRDASTIRRWLKKASQLGWCDYGNK